MRKIVVVALFLFAFYGCASSTFTSKPEGAEIHIGKTDISGQAPVEGRVPRTTFGRYPVKVSKPGFETLYGLLPLDVSGGVIFLDVLFFAPATFFNVQGSFNYYEFDLEKKLIRYRDTTEADWREYMIPPEQQAAVMRYWGVPATVEVKAVASPDKTPQVSPAPPVPAVQTEAKE